jgi:MFS superfamily sulfate permease-like transporter
MSKNNIFRELLEIVKGFFLLLLCHFLAGIIIGVIGAIVPIVGSIAFLGFLFVQLIYVLPLINYLKRKDKLGMIKGVIICAVITALIYGSCYLLLFSISR